MIVINNTDHISHFEKNIVLIPGVNDISEKQLKMLRAHGLFKKMEESETMEVKEDVKDISGYSAPKAIKAVKDTYSVPLLKEWKAIEKRKTVLVAIQEQIDTLLGIGQEKKEEDTFI